ncbi:winged helix-turn-helix domain-containing protein [Thalassotalea litorea]|uniref:winged helix-turn-helix domain-containing protein n=1 Tax=Thalassotalea litorea TaxID=2020715 RepID=UPI003736E73E
MIYRLNNIDIDTRKFEVRVAGKPVHVEPKLFDLIVYFINHQQRIISRDELFQEIWLGRDVSDATLSNHIKSARNLLGDDAESQRVIKTIRSRGYQFVGEIQTEQPPKVGDLQPIVEARQGHESQDKPASPNLFFEGGNFHKRLIVLIPLLIGLFFLVWLFLNDRDANLQTDTAPYLLVVPFSVSSHDSEHWQPFADQMTRELIQDLRKVSGLKTVPPPSSFAFKHNKSRDHIRTQLPDIDYVLDGVVSEATDGSMQITAEVEHLSSGKLMWSGDFSVQGEQRSLFAIQNQIASSVSASLQVLLIAEEKSAIEKAPTEIPQAHKLYTQGQFQMSLMTHQSLRKAIKLFNQAIVLDQNYEQVYFAKSNAYRLLMTNYEPPKDVFPNVIASATEMLTLNPDSAEIKSSLGLAYVHVWLWDEAWKMLSEARQADDQIANTQLGFALYHSALGNQPSVKHALMLADNLDPLNPEISDWGIWALMMSGDIENAIRFGQDKVSLNPKLPHLYTALAIAQYIRGDFEQSLALAKRGVLLSQGEPFHKIVLAQSLAAQKNVTEARQLLNQVEQSKQYVCPYETAIVYLLLEDIERAFQYFDKAVETKSNCLMFIRNDPRLVTLKSDSRYLSLLTAVGLDDGNVQRLQQSNKLNDTF